MKVEKGFADVNGTRIYYEMAGSGHPLVLVHGFTLDTRMWDDQFGEFVDHYRVIRYDMRGFGRSKVPVFGEGYRHSDDLKALLDHLGMDKASVIGLSMGGRIAIDFAIAYPEVTHSLIPVDTALGGYKWSKDFRKFLNDIYSTGREKGAEAAKKVFLYSALFEPALENSILAPKVKLIISDYSGWGLVNEDPQETPTIPAIQQLEKIRAPTLVIVGERDLPDFHEIADILQRNIPSARKIILKGVGHMANMEAPEEFNEAVLNFISRVNVK